MKSVSKDNEIFIKTINFTSWHYTLKSNLKELSDKFLFETKKTTLKYFSEGIYFRSILEKKKMMECY